MQYSSQLANRSLCQSALFKSEQFWSATALGQIAAISAQEMAGQDCGTERGEANKNKAEDGVDEAEEGRADLVGDEANDDNQHREPRHQAGGGHQDSPRGSTVAQD